MPIGGGAVTFEELAAAAKGHAPGEVGSSTAPTAGKAASHPAYHAAGKEA